MFIRQPSKTNVLHHPYDVRENIVTGRLSGGVYRVGVWRPEPFFVGVWRPQRNFPGVWRPRN